MDGIEYAQLRKGDWYTSVERDIEIEDSSFWCMEQMFIHKDVYLTMSRPLRPMHPIKMEYLKAKNYFAQDVDVIEQMGLQNLMECQCNYNTALIQQFFATLVMCGDDARTIKWMTGSTMCEANFFDFAAVLGYDFDGSTAMGHRLHSPDKPEDRKSVV